MRALQSRGMRTTMRVMAAALLAAMPVSAQTRPAVQEARRLMQDAQRAWSAGDYAAATAALERAALLRADHPALLYSLARAAAASGDDARARSALEQSARLGLAANPARDTVFRRLHGDAAFLRSVSAFEANAEPRVVSTAAFALGRSDLLAEGIAHDARTGRFFVSAVHGNIIVAVDVRGTATTFADSAGGLAGAFGMVVDGPRRRLWVATSAVAESGASSKPRGHTAVHRYDVDSGALQAVFTPRAHLEGEGLGDVTVDTLTGDVYVSDAGAGVIYRIAEGSDSLQALVPQGVLDSPQGLVFHAAHGALVIADYSSGLWRLDLARRELVQLRSEAGTYLLGMDGLAAFGNDVVAVQNYPAPHRVIRLTLSEDLRVIRSATVLEAAHPLHDEPTLGVAAGDAFYYVANSQWGKFGAGFTGARSNVVILRLPLGH